MFHLLVKYRGWANHSDTVPSERVLKFTEPRLVEFFKPRDVLDIDRVSQYPALFMSEIGGPGPQLARLGSITSIQMDNGSVSLGYSFDAEMPGLQNVQIGKAHEQLGIVDGFELKHTHWSVRDIDLFRTLLRLQLSPVSNPKAFELDQAESVDERLISVMMPFDQRFDVVLRAIQSAATQLQMKCVRADELFKADTILRNVVSTINTSRVVICDCTGGNPNVFYEIGIAHSLGRDVVLIANRQTDLPANLAHTIYLPYETTTAGLAKLQLQLVQRVTQLRNT